MRAQARSGWVGFAPQVTRLPCASSVSKSCSTPDSTSGGNPGSIRFQKDAGDLAQRKMRAGRGEQLIGAVLKNEFSAGSGWDYFGRFTNNNANGPNGAEIFGFE